MCLSNCIQYFFTSSKTEVNEELKNLNLNTIPYFSFNQIEFNAIPCNIYDGDTFSVVFKYKDEYIKYRCRCYGYDSPEMKPLLSNPNRNEEIRLAKLAKDKLIDLLYKNSDGLIKIKCHNFDKYGRILVTVYNNIDNESINDIMIREKYGKPYYGGHKE